MVGGRGQQILLNALLILLGSKRILQGQNEEGKPEC